MEAGTAIPAIEIPIAISRNVKSPCHGPSHALRPPATADPDQPVPPFDNTVSNAGPLIANSTRVNDFFLFTWMKKKQQERKKKETRTTPTA